jgi:hypothetical protein
MDHPSTAALPLALGVHPQHERAHESVDLAPVRLDDARAISRDVGGRHGVSRYVRIWLAPGSTNGCASAGTVSAAASAAHPMIRDAEHAHRLRCRPRHADPPRPPLVANGPVLPRHLHPLSRRTTLVHAGLVVRDVSLIAPLDDLAPSLAAIRREPTHGEHLAPHGDDVLQAGTAITKRARGEIAAVTVEDVERHQQRRRRDGVWVGDNEGRQGAGRARVRAAEPVTAVGVLPSDHTAGSPRLAAVA